MFGKNISFPKCSSPRHARGTPQHQDRQSDFIARVLFGGASLRVQTKSEQINWNNRLRLRLSLGRYSCPCRWASASSACCRRGGSRRFRWNWARTGTSTGTGTGRDTRVHGSKHASFQDANLSKVCVAQHLRLLREVLPFALFL